MDQSRRNFLKVLGVGAAGLALTGKDALADQAEKVLDNGNQEILIGASEKPGEIFLTWKGKVDADKYNVYFSEENINGKKFNDSELSTILNCYAGQGDIKKVIVNNLKPNKDYFFKVVSKKDKFNSKIVPVKTTSQIIYSLDNKERSFKVTEANSLVYNTDSEVYVFQENGSRLGLEFEAHEKPEKSYLYLKGLSSSTSGALNGGYSPFNLKLNDEFVQIGMSFGSHSGQDVSFEINPKKGMNKLEIELLGNFPIIYEGENHGMINALTGLWLKSIKAECIFGEHYKNIKDLSDKLK